MSEVKVNKITPTAACGTVTLGDSGDTFSIPSGVTLDIQGSSSGVLDIQWDTTAKTSAFTAVAGNGYFVNTTSAAITVTLPASPSAGDFVAVKDYANTADTNNITIARNGSNIQGTANDFTISTEGLSIALIYVDATQGWVSTGASKASDISEQALFVTATGGTITTCGDFKIHTFTGPGTFCVSSAGNAVGSNSVDYLVVAGGGGAMRDRGGGGGAGGYRASGFGPAPLQGTALPVSVTGYPITVGGGGNGNPSTPCRNGSDSIFSTITSSGGGYTQAAGGSGGGGRWLSCGGAGNTPPVSPPQGNPGGNSSPGAAAAGGGGGATAAGSPAPSNNNGGPGGAGAPNAITGTATTYAGGGGGGGYQGSGGSGGAGGGGPGGPSQGTVGTAGTANTGGGAGGGTTGCGSAGDPADSANGGSGVVIIRYKFQ